MSDAPEFTRPVLLAMIGAKPFRQAVVADEAERAALARRFDLVALDRFSATVELIRRAGDLVLLCAAFEAEFVQECVATLDPVPGSVAEQFELLYGPPEAEEGAAGPVSEAIAFEPLSGDVIDVGEAVAQEFSLSLPPFPRSPSADETTATAGDEPRPFSELARLLGRTGREPG
jgi:uncharacterized metal-binding protein YceD (DUF177 family)